MHVMRAGMLHADQFQCRIASQVLDPAPPPKPLTTPWSAIVKSADAKPSSGKQAAGPGKEAAAKPEAESKAKPAAADKKQAQADIATDPPEAPAAAPAAPAEPQRKDEAAKDAAQESSGEAASAEQGEAQAAAPQKSAEVRSSPLLRHMLPLRAVAAAACQTLGP
jgi:pyruvate dehydrogenase E2 component (dihydrolipoamide acetyltransferase)